MDIKGISGQAPVPKGSLQTARDYTESVTTEKKDLKPLDKIRENSLETMKGNKIDTRA